MKDPAFLFYSSDFLTGTMTMAFEDRGKYITLLCAMHQQGRMREETIRFLIGSISDSLKKKFKIDSDGFWFNERLEFEIQRRAKFVSSRRENGMKGGRKKKPLDITIEKAKNNLIENENIIENEKIIENKQKRVVREKFMKPSLEEVTAYCSERKCNVNPSKFFNFYESKGWMVGKNKMKNWQAAVRNWENQDNSPQKTIQKTLDRYSVGVQDYSTRLK